MLDLYFFSVLNIDAALPLRDCTAKWCLDAGAALISVVTPVSQLWHLRTLYVTAINRCLNTSSNVRRGGSEHVQTSPDIPEVWHRTAVAPCIPTRVSGCNHSLGHHNLRVCSQQETWVQCLAGSEHHQCQGKAEALLSSRAQPLCTDSTVRQKKRREINTYHPSDVGASWGGLWFRELLPDRS